MNASRSALAVIAILAALTTAAPARAAAQEGSQPNLIFTIFGGASAGYALWRVDRQPLCVLINQGGGSFDCPASGAQYDTLGLSRRISSSIIAGLGVSYFANPHFGFQGEISYLGLSLEDRCDPPAAFQPDTELKNQQICNDFSASNPSTSAVSFFVGGVARAFPRGVVDPYLRAGVGFVALSGGTVTSEGQFELSDGSLFTRELIVDQHPRSVRWSVQLGVGFVAALSPGYAFRLEARDVIVPLGVVDGPANVFAIAPQSNKVFHNFALTAGLDIILEKKPGRRY